MRFSLDLKLIPLLLFIIIHSVRVDSIFSLPSDNESSDNSLIIASDWMTAGANSNSNDQQWAQVPPPALISDGTTQNCPLDTKYPSRRHRRRDGRGKCPNPSTQTAGHGGGSWNDETHEQTNGDSDGDPTSEVENLNDLQVAPRVKTVPNEKICHDPITNIPACTTFDRALSDPPGSRYYTLIVPYPCM